MKAGTILLLLAVMVASLFTGTCSNPEPLAPNGREPNTSRPTFTELYVIGDNHLSDAEVVMLQGLQGIIAQSPEATEGIWIDVANGYEIWLSDLENEYGVTLDYTYQDDPWGLVSYFKSYLEGTVIYDLGQDSVNVAGTLAGILRLLPVDTALLEEANALSLGEVLDVRGKDEEWCFDNYWDMANHSLVIFQEKNKHYALRDYAAARKAFVFHDGDTDFTRRVFASVDHGGMVLGWGGAGWNDEKHFVQLSSERNLVLIPADHARNMSILTTFDLTLQRKKDIHYVTFVMCDGDNVQWQLNDFATDERWYGSPRRGSFPMGWTISPSMAILAPTVMQRLYWDATAVDAFIGGVSGRGYYYPSEFPTLAEEVVRLGGALARADLNALMIMDTDSDAFSPEYLKPYAGLENVIGGFWSWYDNYSGREGEILFVDDKPFVSMKYDLWLKDASWQTVDSVISDIASGINTGGGYTAISVHPWSMSLADVYDLIGRLDPHVRVVDPIEFLQLAAADQRLR